LQQLRHPDSRIKYHIIQYVVVWRVSIIRAGQQIVGWKVEMILFFGDVHGKFAHVEWAVAEHTPAAIILLGDIEAPVPLDLVLAKLLAQTEVWFIPGNHDTDSPALLANLTESKLAHRNLHGRVAVIDGVRVAGLGGVFRQEVWWPGAGTPNYESYADYQQQAAHSLVVRPGGAQQLKVAGKLLKHRSTIFSQDYEALAVEAADILVTHEAPSCHPYGFRAIDELARSLGVTASFHGHNHDNLDYQAKWPELGFRAYGVGLRGITDMQGAVLRPGELDERRATR
jgi:predicted phosphodiesterase